MSPLDSPVWYRVAALRPRLRDHLRVRRHRYRGQRWFVLEDLVSGRTNRLDEAGYALVALMDGDRTMQQIWSRVDEERGENAPSQDQAIELLGRLHAADALQCEWPPDTGELFSRYQKHHRARVAGAFRSPFFVRIPLLDPDQWLRIWAPALGFLFSRAALAAWVALIAGGALLAASHAEALGADAGSLLRPANLLLLWLAYPLVKAVHELAHALAVRHWGGEVHEMGIMLLVFVPVPYVDASAANAFENKWARVTVAAAGIAVELGLAAFAMLVWLAVEPGLLRMLALDVMLIGGVSTVLFNGNPLLRFDGYYMLADAIEIPNLGSRSNRYWSYLARRYLAGIATARSPVRAAGERRWFVGYGMAAFLYRMLILVAIILFVTEVSLTAGIVLGAWAVIGQWILPVMRAANRMRCDPELRKRRARVLVSSTAGAAVALALVLYPVPYRTISHGVVWPTNDAQLRTGTDCFVEEILRQPGNAASQGDPLLRCSEPALQHDLANAEADIAELLARYTAANQSDRANARLIADQLDAARQRLDDARSNVSALTVRSPANGVFVLPRSDDLAGRFLAKGENIGYIVAPASLGVRVAVDQRSIGLVRERNGPVLVRLAGGAGEPIPATLLRAPGAATTRLSGAALGDQGGGPLATDRRDVSGQTAAEPIFELELGFVQTPPHLLTGSRVHVRFDHGRAPLLAQWFHSARQLLLRRLAV